MAKKISIRELGRRINMSDTSVHRAIQAGKLLDCYDKVSKKIDWSKAQKNEWVQGAKVIKPQAGISSAKAIDKMNKAEGVKHELLSNGPKSVYGVLKSESKTELPEWNGVDVEALTEKELIKFLDLTATMDVREALRIKEIIAAAKAKIELKQLTEELVPKSDVDKAYYQYGARFKKSLLQIPDIIIDDLMATNDKIEAMTIFKKALIDVMDEYSRPPEIIKQT